MSSMFFFPESAYIAIYGTAMIAETAENHTTNTIADKLGASVHHVAKVMRQLKKNGFLKSRKGPRGGFKLMMKAEAISLLDLYECVEGKVFTEEIPSRHTNDFMLKDIITGLTNKFIHEMSNINLSELIK